MTAAVSLAVSRRRAPFEAIRLFLGGTRWWIAALVVVWLVWPLFVMSRDLVFVAFASTMVAAAFAITAAVLDRKVADRLAFISLLPRAGSPKLLLLVPLYVAALLFVGMAAVTAGRPPLIALAGAGCCCWMAAMGRWLGRRWWTLAAIPALALAPLSVLAVFRHGSWGAAAALSSGFAALGLLLSPEMRPGASQASVRAPAAGTQGAASVPDGRPIGVAAALRLWRLGAVQNPRWMAIVLVFALVASFAWLPSIVSYQQGFRILAVAAWIAIARSCKAERQEFLGVLPIGRRQLFGGSVLPWVLPLLVIPVVLIAHLLLETPGGAGPLARALRDPQAVEVRLLRAYLGGALPQTWPRGAFPAESWRPAVNAVCAQIGRLALLALSTVASLTAAQLVSERKSMPLAPIPRWSVYLLAVVLFFGGPSLVNSAMAPLGVMVLLLAVCALVWFLVWRLPPTPASPSGRPR